MLALNYQRLVNYLIDYVTSAAAATSGLWVTRCHEGAIDSSSYGRKHPRLRHAIGHSRVSTAKRFGRLNRACYHMASTREEMERTFLVDYASMKSPSPSFQLVPMSGFRRSVRSLPIFSLNFYNTFSSVRTPFHISIVSPNYFLILV